MMFCKVVASMSMVSNASATARGGARNLGAERPHSRVERLQRDGVGLECCGIGVETVASSMNVHNVVITAPSATAQRKRNRQPTMWVHDDRFADRSRFHRVCKRRLR